MAVSTNPPYQNPPNYLTPLSYFKSHPNLPSLPDSLSPKHQALNVTSLLFFLSAFCQQSSWITTPDGRISWKGMGGLRWFGIRFVFLMGGRGEVEFWFVVLVLDLGEVLAHRGFCRDLAITRGRRGRSVGLELQIRWGMQDFELEIVRWRGIGNTEYCTEISYSLRLPYDQTLSKLKNTIYYDRRTSTWTFYDKYKQPRTPHAVFLYIYIRTSVNECKQLKPNNLRAMPCRTLSKQWYCYINQLSLNATIRFSGIPGARL